MEQAFVGDERGLVFGVLVHGDLPIAALKVKACKVLSIPQ
jgi:hypothetical protein